MADQPTTPSGSRWEPEPRDAETPATPGPVAPPAYDLQPPEAALEDTSPDEGRAGLRNRAALAGAATALALGAGVTGFAIGHATAGQRHDGFTPANFSGRAPGNSQLGQGQQVPPGLGHDWDQNGDGGRSDQQAPGTSGSPGSSSGSNGSGTSANPT